ncbi:MAG: type transport system permease protein [Chloroflexota bacterium]|jgi:ABC-2 type transport system permease protein|nr:type transport system permease protein [Chloroflexota bacterium]
MTEASLFDSGRTRGRGIADLLRSYRTAAALGWKMEANWTDPVLFFIYSVAKPVSAALILIVMLEVIAGAGRDYRGYVVVGSALWSFVISGIAGLAWSVLDDRERYRMLKYVYVSPSDFVTVLLGRGTARIAVGAMGAAITLVIGVGLLGVAFDPSRVDWPLLLAVMVLGLEAIVVVGVILAAICLQTRQEAWSYPEAVAGALFLVSGAVFPLAVLPAPVQALGLANPLTWWLEGVRHALFPGGISSVGGSGALYTELTGRAAPDGATIVVALLATGAVATLAATVVFRWSEHRAKDRGLIDQTTGS